MMLQIEKKVVNQLRQVTSAIKQDGANQVSVITSAAEREAAVEFAKAAALRPQIVGARADHLAGSGDLQGIVRDPRNPEHPRGQSGDRTGTPRPNIARRPHRLPNNTALPSELKCAGTPLEAKNWKVASVRHIRDARSLHARLIDYRRSTQRNRFASDDGAASEKPQVRLTAPQC